jgi:hypothetical protein
VLIIVNGSSPKELDHPKTDKPLESISKADKPWTLFFNFEHTVEIS